MVHVRERFPVEADQFFAILLILIIPPTYKVCGGIRTCMSGVYSFRFSVRMCIRSFIRSFVFPSQGQSF